VKLKHSQLVPLVDPLRFVQALQPVFLRFLPRFQLVVSILNLKLVKYLQVTLHRSRVRQRASYLD